jgi:hypothetical protein
MLRFLSLIILLFPLQSNATTYAVNIAVYKNIKTLQHRIKKLPPKLQKTIVIKKKKNLYKARTLPTENLHILQQLLPRYKSEFSDAHITELKIGENEKNYFKER